MTIAIIISSSPIAFPTKTTAAPFPQSNKKVGRPAFTPYCRPTPAVLGLSIEGKRTG